MTPNFSPLARYDAAKRLPQRYRSEKRFRMYSKISLFLVFSFLLVLLVGIISRGAPALQKTKISLEIYFNPFSLNERGSCALKPILQDSFSRVFPHYTSEEIRNLLPLVSPGACEIFLGRIREHPEDKNKTLLVWIPASDDVDLFLKHRQGRNSSHKYRRLNVQQIQALNELEQKGRIKTVFNMDFFLQGDARNPEFAGIAGAFIGSFYVIVISLLFAFPIGIAAALYLEEFKREGWLARIIEVNVSNLVAVPSIVFGLLGLALFLGLFRFPRSSALVGGLTLGLMTMPTIILTSRSALAAVPKSIRYAAQALGASEIQVIFHHVFPLALPGILTGTIIGTARALGETAPLLMIGMMAFIKDIPRSPLEPASVLPMQIFTWARNPEPGFIAYAAAGIMVLLIFVILINIGALILRHRFTRKL
jgi:phosphate transport system permease protein